MFNTIKSGSNINEAVTIDAIKAHCRISTTADDDYLDLLRIAAREQVEADLNLPVVGQAFKLYVETNFPVTQPLPFANIQSIDSITYTDADGQTQTLDDSYYTLKPYKDPPVIEFDTPPTAQDFVVTFVAGFIMVDPDDTDSDGDNTVPQLIKQAILFLVAHWYEHRESSMESIIKEVPQGYARIIQRLRVSRFR